MQLLWIGVTRRNPFATFAERYAQAGIPFYVCPGTSSWNTIAGRTSNALGNLEAAAKAGRAYRAAGYLITDWGDNGHWQPLSVSYLGFAAGACLSWRADSAGELDLPGLLDQFAFRDAGGVMGRAAYDLGEVYRATGVLIPNSSALFWLLQFPVDEVRSWGAHANLKLAQSYEAIEGAVSDIEAAQMAGSRGELIAEELQLAGRMLRHAVLRGILLLDQAGRKPNEANPGYLRNDLVEMVQCYQQAWLKRCRPGGLPDSLKRFENARMGYN